MRWQVLWGVMACAGVTGVVAPPASAQVAQQPKGEVGYLSVTSEPAAKVFVDDVDTKLTTPVAHFELKAGHHKLTLVSVDGARLDVTTALTLGRILSALDGALGSVDAVQRRRLPLRTLLAEVLRGEEVPAWEG